DLVGKINAHPVIYWLNIVVVIAVITTMLAGWLDPAFSFVLGVAVLLPLNFNSARLQIDRIKEHAPNAMMMASVIIAAAVFLGVLNESDMLEHVALAMLQIIPRLCRTVLARDCRYPSSSACYAHLHRWLLLFSASARCSHGR